MKALCHIELTVNIFCTTQLGIITDLEELACKSGNNHVCKLKCLSYLVLVCNEELYLQSEQQIIAVFADPGFPSQYNGSYKII